MLNRIPQFLRQVTHEQRQNRPTIQISPVGDGADKETAEIEQGIARHVEVLSDGDIAYDTAFDSMATGGFGYFRFTTEYTDEMSFDQEIRFGRTLAAQNHQLQDAVQQLVEEKQGRLIEIQSKEKIAACQTQAQLDCAREGQLARRAGAGGSRIRPAQPAARASA